MSSPLFLAAASAGILLAGCTSVGGDPVSETQAGRSADLSADEAARATSASTGPLSSGSAAQCVEGYTPKGVARRGFAFDGTVVGIADGTTDRPGKGRLHAAAVTFAVDTWYVGGSTSRITIDVAPPGGGRRLDEAPPTYEVGTRLLVSGESRWGEGVLQDGLAWGCGFTRYYDAETADRWRDATG